MATNQEQRNTGKEDKLPAAGTGNASNPTPDPANLAPANKNQLLDEKAEKYLREVSSPEDYPDAVEEQQIDEQNNQSNSKDRQDS